MAAWSGMTTKPNPVVCITAWQMPCHLAGRCSFDIPKEVISSTAAAVDIDAGAVDNGVDWSTHSIQKRARKKRRQQVQRALGRIGGPTHSDENVDPCVPFCHVAQRKPNSDK
jgi:hypothetical protein